MIQNGLFYTAMSRVKTGDNFFIRNFNENYVRANPAVEEKKKAMELFSKYEFKKVYLHEQIFENFELRWAANYRKYTNINGNCY